MSKPRLLDLFCGAGGAAAGYVRAGFEVVGVDIAPQPHYPFEFIQADVLDVFDLEFRVANAWKLDGLLDVDVIHASPPCQRFSKAVRIVDRPDHPDLVGPTRELLRASGLPYVIENVPRAPLVDPIRLCGSAFGLPIRRHRMFESNVALLSNGCAHNDMAYPAQYPSAWNRTTPLRVLSISNAFVKGQPSLAIHKAAMGVDWEMTAAELSEAIPPAYTEFIGGQLLGALAADRLSGIYQSEARLREAERLSLLAGTHKPAVDDFGTQYLEPHRDPMT